MHEHKWKITFKKEPWRESPEQGLLMAYEVKINRCDCGEEKKVKTAPKGIWWKGINSNPEKVKVYPEKWKKTIADCLTNSSAINNDISMMAERFVRCGLTWAEAEELSRNLVMDGCAEKFERYPRRTPKDIRLVVPQPVVQFLRVLLDLNKREGEEGEISAFFDEWEKIDLPDTSAGSLIAQMAEMWRNSKKPLLPARDAPVILRSLQTYKLILETLKTIALLNIADETIPYRELSLRVSGDTKGLISIKPYLKRILGKLEDCGITDHAPIVLCRASVIGEVKGRTLDLSAAADYTVLTEATALAFKPVHAQFKSILLIENQTSFETAAANLPEDICCVFLAGYPSSHIRSFVKNLLRFNPVSGHIWCDIDPDGIEIALTAGKWFEESGVSWQPLGMDKEMLLKATTTKPLDDRNRGKITTLRARTDARLFHELLGAMESIGKKLEQETISPDKLLNTGLGFSSSQ